MIDNKENKKEEVLLTEERKNIKNITEKENPLSNLNEGWLSWAGKIFFTGVATYLAGVAMEKLGAGDKKSLPKLPFKIKGTPEQIQAVTGMLLASRRFQEELSKPNATIDGVINKLNIKNMTAEKFKQTTGKNWPFV